MKASEVIEALALLANDTYAMDLQRFFKTGPGEYGEGDQFIGVRMPDIRMVCKHHRAMPLVEVRKLIESPFHEHRMAGLILLTMQYPKAVDKQAIYELYIEELAKGYINNWDFVDVTCRAVVGEHLRHNRNKLFDLANSDSLWERRVAIVSTFPYIAAGDPSTSMELAEVLLHDKHDLMHKAVGWTLREVGKRCDEALLRSFLDHHASGMPRTALRYAIERLPEQDRRRYMAAKTSS
ncbi:DNA alkylation repair protein [Candidatus Saccharibacteria bacterium]|nr:DNA alkylation repair protein [Candidatus Saccharibacteria bacterium]